MRIVVKIDEKEVKRYLRIHGQFDGIDDVIANLSQKATSLLCPKSIVGRFDITHVDNGIKLDGTQVSFAGNLIKKVFAGCDEIYIFAATLTLQSEIFLKQCFAKSTVEGVVCDSVLTTMIESYCDDVEDAIAKKIFDQGKTPTKRISCGYGDFAISSQKDILNLLGAQKYLGIQLNDNNMMYPNKTVTAVVGAKKADFANMESSQIIANNNKCGDCQANCDFKRDI